MTPPVNVAAHLARMAAAEPARPAVHFPPRGVNPDGPTEYVTLTFAELHAESDALAHGLTAAGIGRGARAALMVPPSPEFFALTFALLKAGIVPVMIDPGMGAKNLGTCLAEAEPAAFIGVPKAHLARRILGWAKRSIRTTVNVGRDRFFCDHSLRQLRDSGLSLGPFTPPPLATDETAAILFTSGSTGIAKGAVYTHGNFAAQVELLKATYGIEPGEVDLCTFPLFALFGPALGMTCVVPDMDASRPATLDPRKAVAQVRQFGVTNLFGSPAVIRRLGDYAASLQPERSQRGASPLSPSPLAGEGWGGGCPDTLHEGTSPLEPPTPHPNPPPQGGREKEGAFFPTLRRAISAGAPASIPAIERFAKLLPASAEVFTPYGATEALPVANIGSREILGETRALTDQGKGVCVGRPVAGVTVYVIPISDGPVKEWDALLCLPPGEVGEFVVRGPMVTREYFRRPEATALAKICDPRTGEVLHRMGDVGYLDDRGRLWFCGRKSHRVVTPWGTLFTDMVEPVFNATLPSCQRTALVGVTRGGVTYAVLCYEPSKAAVPVERLHEIAGRYDHTRAINTFLRYDGLGFPMDVRHNSKIFREKLAVWADKKLGPRWNPGTKAQGRTSLGSGGRP